jgi:hypothetical protein
VNQTASLIVTPCVRGGAGHGEAPDYETFGNGHGLRDNPRLSALSRAIGAERAAKSSGIRTSGFRLDS